MDSEQADPAGELTEALREVLEELRLVETEKELTEDLRCYSEEEAADLLGVSAKTLQRERVDGRIRGIRVRGQVRYTHRQLVRYLESREAI